MLRQNNDFSKKMEEYEMNEPLKKPVIVIPPWLSPLISLITLILVIAGFIILKNHLGSSVSTNEKLNATVDDLTQKVDNLSVLVDANDTLTLKVDNAQTDISLLINMVRDLQDTGAVADLQMGSAPLQTLNLHFTCIDAIEGTPLTGCQVTVHILEQENLSEFTVNADREEILVVPVKLRLSITSRVEGYKLYSNIMEYIDDGTEQVFEIKMN